jgi:hypothetical protein
MTHPSILRAHEAIADATEAVEASQREREERTRANPLAETVEWQSPEPEPTPIAVPRSSRELKDEYNAAAWHHFVEQKIQADWDTVRYDVVAGFVVEFVAKKLTALIERIDAAELVIAALQTEINVLRSKAADGDRDDVVLTFKRTSTDVA